MIYTHVARLRGVAGVKGPLDQQWKSLGKVCPQRAQFPNPATNLLSRLGDVLRIASDNSALRVEQLELFGSAFDGARWGWDCPTMIVTAYVKHRPSVPLVAQCVLFI